MAEKNLLTKQCIKCGAPLIQKDDELYCEYCHTSYKIPKEYKAEHSNYDQSKGDSDPTNIPNPEFYRPIPEVSQQYHEKQANQQKLSCGRVLLFLLAILGGIGLIFYFLTRESHTAEPIDPQKEIEQQMYEVLAGSTSSVEAFPGGFTYEKPIALGAIIDTVTGTQSNRVFYIEIVVKNLTENPIVSDSKSDRMVILSSTVEDNLGNKYSCQISNYFSNSDLITYGQQLNSNQLTELGRLTCNSTLPPEVKYIQVGIELTNWGKYNFQIPMVMDFQKLNLQYTFHQSENDFSINVDFTATPPQYVAIYYNDISVIDDKGNTYPLEYCGDFLSSFIGADMGPYYTNIARSSNVWAQLSCEFKGQIPYEVNAITLIMNIRGNTVTHTITTDTVQ